MQTFQTNKYQTGNTTSYTYLKLYGERHQRCKKKETHTSKKHIHNKMWKYEASHDNTNKWNNTNNNKTTNTHHSDNKTNKKEKDQKLKINNIKKRGNNMNTKK